MTYYPTGLTVIDTSAILKPIVTMPPKPPPPPPKTIRYPSTFGRRGAVRQSLGACCDSCAQTGGTCGSPSSVGATAISRVPTSALVQAQVIPGMVAAGGGGVGTVVKLALVAGLAAGGYFLVKKLRARKA